MVNFPYLAGTFGLYSRVVSPKEFPLTHDERAASLALSALTGPESGRADSLYELVKTVAGLEEPHKRQDCVDAVLDSTFHLMPAHDAAKAARR